MARILHISQRYWPPAFGGAELYMRTVAEWNVRCGHTVDVWTTDALDTDALWNPTKRKIKLLKEVVEGVNITRFKVSPLILNNFFFNKGLRYILWHSPSWFLQCFGSPPMVIGMYMQLLNRKLPKYDIIHVAAMPYCSIFYVGMMLARKQGAKFYMTPCQHVGVAGKYVTEDKYYNPRVLPFFEAADKIFVHTESERNELTKFFKKYGDKTLPFQVVKAGFSKENTEETYSEETPKILVATAKVFIFFVKLTSAIVNFVLSPFRRSLKGREIDPKKMVKVGLGIYPDEFVHGGGDRFRKEYDIPKGTPIVFSVGAMSFVKGVRGTIGAMEILWKQGIKAKLVLAGNKTVEFDNYWENASEIIKKNTVVLDKPSDSIRYDLYDAGDIFSLPSKSESFGIVYLEAWIYKKPVIGCNIGSVSEVIDNNVDGFLVEFDNIKEISEKLLKLIQNPKLREEMGEKGYAKTLENNTWEKKFKILKPYF
ncbi:glycosyltransferase family 4 protein [Candidatus Dojkabacteria bacterium]|jgi:glycosyltransferase involved in cell wall biosynthesis|nr:glycosyltransferase family 4 protein [Candidatus Dojkabacteria bacterium]